MAKFSLIINVVLALAIGVLFYQWSTVSSQLTAMEAKMVEEEPEPQPVITKNALEARIVYIQSDSILSKYKYFGDIENQIKSEEQRLQNRLVADQKKLEEDYADAKYKAEAGILPDSRLQEIGRGLQRQEQELLQKRENMLGDLQEMTNNLNRKANERIINYLKDLNEERKYDFILGYQGLGGVMHADSSLDITAEVVTGLNADYDAWKAEQNANVQP